MKRTHTLVIAAVAFTFGTFIIQPNARAEAKDREEIQVVGIVAGYECRGVVLSTGEHINTWTSRPEEAICSCTYLFTVLTPVEHKGRLFYVRDVGPPLRPPNPARWFRPGTRYRFNMTIDASADRSPWLGSVSIFPGVAREASISKEEVDAMLAEFEERESHLRSRMEFYRKRVEQKDVTEDDRQAFRKYIEESEAEIRYMADKTKSLAEELRQARDDFPDIYNLRWELSEEEGWQTMPRAKKAGEPDDSAGEKKKDSPSSRGETQKASPQK